jgi:hypothetical protein
MSQEELQTILTKRAADNAGGDLLAALIDEIRLLPRPWPALPEAEQAEVIERLRARVTHNVTEAVTAIAAAGRVSMAAELAAVAFRDGLRITLDAAKNAAGRHDLIDSLGQPVLLVLAGATDHLGGIGDVVPDADQRRLDLQRSSDDAINRARRGDTPD